MAETDSYAARLLSRRAFLVAASAAVATAHPAAAAIWAHRQRPLRLGAFVNPQNRRLTAAAAAAAFANFESTIGRRLAIRSYFVAWDEEFPNESHEADAAAGRTPLLAWYPPPDLAAVAAGDWDALISARAAAAAEFGRPLLVRFAAEFNGAWSGVHGRQREFIAVWRHLVTAFRRAPNVRWVWCPYALRPTSAADDWRTYWPGGNYVDWVGMDGYNWGTSRAWSSWESFAEIFGRLYADYRRRKPLMICEVASAELGGDKAAWIRDMHAALDGRFADVRALVWFDVNKETDWRVDSSPASLDAFRALAAGRRS